MACDMNTSPSDSSWHLTETYKGMITLSVEALKMLALVNGGAAIAVLTYLGNIVARAPNAVRPNISPALFCYCFGLSLTVLAFVFAYVAQLILYNEERKRVGGAEVPEGHVWLLWFCIALAIGATAAFGVGCFSGVRALVGN